MIAEQLQIKKDMLKTLDATGNYIAFDATHAEIFTLRVVGEVFADAFIFGNRAGDKEAE
jgi:hypothetical protein